MYGWGDSNSPALKGKLQQTVLKHHYFLMDKSHQVTSLVSVITYFIMNLGLGQKEEQASSVTGPGAAEQMQCSSPVTAPLTQSPFAVISICCAAFEFLQAVHPKYYLQTLYDCKVKNGMKHNMELIHGKQANKQKSYFSCLPLNSRYMPSHQWDLSKCWSTVLNRSGLRYLFKWVLNWYLLEKLLDQAQEIFLWFFSDHSLIYPSET